MHAITVQLCIDADDYVLHNKQQLISQRDAIKIDLLPAELLMITGD